MYKLKYSVYTGTSGVYCITNSLDNKVYIGSAVDLYKRSGYHVNALKNNTHSNSHLQNAYNKYGAEYFVISVMEVFVGDNESELRLLENKYTQLHNALDRRFGYNYIEELGDTRKYSDEMKKKMKDVNSIKSRPVISYEPTTDKIEFHKSRTGIDNASSSGICRAVRMGHSYKERMWFNVEDYISDADIRLRNEDRMRKRIENMKSINKKKKIVVNVESGVFYNSIAEAARHHDICTTHLGKQLSLKGIFRNLQLAE